MRNLSAVFRDMYPVSKKIMQLAGKCIGDYNMITPPDGLMVGLSGGKDSLILTLVLATLRCNSPVKFKLRACVIDQSDGKMDIEPIKRFTDCLAVPLDILTHPTYEIMEKRGERSPCSLCANIRRGILANHARESGFNVIALGHHKDDAAETVLLNLLYGGRFKCYHPNMYMTRSKVRVIRPLSYIDERRLRAEAGRLSLPVADSCCPYSKNSKRTDAKKILEKLENNAPDIKNNILHALQNFDENDIWIKKLLNGN